MEDERKRQGDIPKLGGDWRETPKGVECYLGCGLSWSEFGEDERGRIVELG